MKKKNHIKEKEKDNIYKKKADASAGNTVNNSITPTLEASAYDNNIPQNNKNVKLLPTNNDMQNMENNANKINLPTNKDLNLRSLEESAPTAGKVGKEVAKGITEGIKEGIESEEENK